MPTVKTFLLPDLGEGLTEAELLTWTVKVGDTVTLNQIIAEVETAKASVELPSPYSGTVVALHAQQGTTVGVGSPFIDVSVTESESESESDDIVSHPPLPDPTSNSERTPVLVGYGVADESSSRRRTRTTEVVPPVNDQSGETYGRPLASPPVRFAATHYGIDLAQVEATGTYGNVTRDDLERHRAATPRSQNTALNSTEPSDAAPSESTSFVYEEERIPIKGVRKHTAAAMVRSAFSAPHVTEFVTVDITATMELLRQLRETQHFHDIRLTPLALVSKALLVALRTNPSLNSYWDEDAGDIVVKRFVNLGIAAATPRGLMVPNIKNAHTLGLRDLALALAELTATAKDGRSDPADLSDGTITITNVGVFGVDAGTPILNPGEAAILCFGSIRRQPWEYQDEIALRSVTTLSLSFDHRLVDGEQGSKFLATIARILSDPMTLIALS